MEEIIGMIQALKEDHPELIVTDELIKEYIEDNMDMIVNDIRKEI